MLACLLQTLCIGCLCIGSSLAWTTSSNRPTVSLALTRCSSLFARPVSSDSSHLLDDEKANECLHSCETSRRKWLSTIASASLGGAASLVLTNRPASAAAATTAGPIKVEPTDAICDPTVSVWQKDGRLIYLLGTAHISKSSSELAGQLVRDSHPDAVFVELDLKRVAGASSMAKRMEANERMEISSADAPQTKPTKVMVSPLAANAATSTMDSSSIPAASSSSVAISEAPPSAPVEEKKPAKKEGGGFWQNLGAAAVGNGIRSMYSKLGSQGFNPGEEFVTAIREGQKLDAAIVLGDQDVDLTLRRLSVAFQQTDLSRLLNPDSELEQSMREMIPASSSAPTEGMSEDEIFRTELSTYVETIKTKENVKRIMTLMKKEAPTIYQVMVEERDAYMEAGLNALNEFAVITAVMGLAHVDGVESGLRQDGWRPVPVKCPRKKS